MRRHLVGIVGSVAALSLVAAASASAATEFGNRCIGNTPVPSEYTLTTVVSPEPLPVAAPSSGVVTKLRSLVAPLVPVAIPTQVKVLRPTGGGLFTNVGEVTISVLPGETESDARLPVLAGDQLGLHGLPFEFEGEPLSVTYYCSSVAGGVLGAKVGDVPLGSSAEIPAAATGLVPISAVLEPDADGDGYGDETQDLCPQSTATQAACPAVVTLDAVGKPRRRMATVVVAVSSTAPVSVTATVKLGKGRVAKLKAPAKVLGAGKLHRFKLKFTGALNKALMRLPRRKKLTLKITATATDEIGRVSTDRAKAKLRGQA